MKHSQFEKIILASVVGLFGFVLGWLTNRGAAESHEQAAARPFQQSGRERRVSSRNQDGLTEADIRRLGERFRDSPGPKAAFTRGKLLAGMTLENADLIGEFLQGREYYFRLGELQGAGVLELRGKLDQRLFEQALGGWVYSDGHNAMAWYASLPRKEGKDSQKAHACGIIHGLASSDFRTAEEFMTSWLGDDPFKPGDLIKVVFQKRALVMELNDLGEWANQVTNNGALDWKMLTEVGKRALLNDPVKAIEWAMDLPEKRDWVQYRIASRWDDIDAASSSQWLLTRPPGKERDRATSGAFYQWARQDLEGGRAFLSQIESIHDKDLALSGFAWALQNRNPREAISYARQISDSETRNTQIVEIGRNFWRWHPEEAEAWLAQSGLSSEQIKKIKFEPR